MSRFDLATRIPLLVTMATIASACGGETCTPQDDGIECTADVCSGGQPSHAPRPLGFGCSQSGGSLCDGNGACVPPVCGDGITNGGDVCDDGNAVNGDGCDANCTPTGCGNGILTGGEQCEDGNLTSGDGCDDNCTPTACGNGVVTAGERCDDGNLTSGDGCDLNCTPTACGNGVLTAGERCDDGNVADRDGCDGACQYEPLELAMGTPVAPLVRGRPRQLEVIATYPDGERPRVGGLTWSSSDPAIVSVEGGLARGLAGGTATVTASYYDLTTSVEVHVHAERLAFVTSAQGNGNLATWPEAGRKSGLAGADAVCAALAASGELLGTYRAWLSDDVDDAYCRVHGLQGKRADRCGAAALPASAGPWIRTDGLPFAAGIGPLMEGRVLYPAEYDEKGLRRPDESLVLSSTGPDGSRFVTAVSGTCENWSRASSAEFAYVGTSGGGALQWTQAGTFPCGAAAPSLLCLEIGEGEGPPLEPHAATGSLAFLTSFGGAGNLWSWPEAALATGLAAGDAICAGRADAAALPGTFKAWIGDVLTTAESRLVEHGPWVRPDGVVVANDLAELTGGRLRAPIDVDEFGAAMSIGVWTGGTSVSDGRRHDCAGWTSGASEEEGSIGVSSASGSMWNTWVSVSCVAELALYCLEQ